MDRQTVSDQEARTALVLLIGGSGYLDLDDHGCPRWLTRNSLIRMRPYFHAAGFVTALIDAPSDFRGQDGLAGFRMATRHADDLGKVIADLRQRFHGPVWVVGHSRGTISAANAAGRLSGTAAPNGVVLMSAMMTGGRSKQNPWTNQTVFDTPLDAIAVPVLIVGHAADNCARSPARLIGAVAARIHAARQQVAVVTGGPIKPGRPESLVNCGIGDPHDFVDQEAEVAAGILRFIGGDLF
jgi:pimeloyl-ACP methyl ester carboxylesterase